jgi:hypothetical protein
MPLRQSLKSRLRYLARLIAGHIDKADSRAADRTMA